MLCVKEMMLLEKIEAESISGKTGWGIHENRDSGWFVGFIETHDNVYYFANCIQTENKPHPYFEKARKEITLLILRELKIIESPN